MAAHEYGPLVLIYSHVEDFFPPADARAPRTKPCVYCSGKKLTSRENKPNMLSPASRAKMELLYDRHIDPLAEEIKQVIAQHHAEMTAVSPHARLQCLHVPVLLLHGSADNVIPPTELLWLQHDVPSTDLVISAHQPRAQSRLAGGQTNSRRQSPPRSISWRRCWSWSTTSKRARRGR